MSDDTGLEQSDTKFKPGQSGNPAGRPKGSRTKLGETFLQDVLDDWVTHGKQAIIDMREKDAAAYVRTVASTLPRELNVKVSEIDELTDEQLARQLAHIVAELAAAGFGIGEGVGAEASAQSVGGLSTLQ